MRLIASKTMSNNSVRTIIKGTSVLVLLFAFVGSMFYVWYIGPWLGDHIFHSRLIAELTVFTAAWFALRAIQTYLAFVLRGFHRIGLAAFVDGATTAILITVALAYLLFFDNLTEIRSVLIIVIGALASTVTVVIFLVQKNYRLTKMEQGFSFKEPIKIGLPLSILAISSVGINEAYVWIAGMYVSPVDVAIYGAALRLSKFVQMPLFIINGVIPSTIAQPSATNDTARIQKILQSVAVIAFVPSLLISFVVFLASEEILTVVFGSSYAAGWDILLIMVIGQTVSVAVGSPGVLMAMTGHQTILMIISAAAGLIGIVMSLILVEKHGVSGIVIGAVSGLMLQNLVMWTYCLVVMKIKTHASLVSMIEIKDKIMKNKF